MAQARGDSDTSVLRNDWKVPVDQMSTWRQLDMQNWLAAKDHDHSTTRTCSSLDRHTEDKSRPDDLVSISTYFTPYEDDEIEILQGLSKRPRLNSKIDSVSEDDTKSQTGL
mmetsp:Transcript_56236/g.67438  ORF Transcript_56236/g.67438 Transcript_56236/m.67438 type:complete len:111 (-) Transcript_56236:67-399(-)|eukprot:CAMPEP_0172518920 /NCGR_PEP_ID=MMETSP1066-20121228/291109_1 /TAXON_ID=671091 /ORGANISM="Coscinodiscus wailesii, Strain CCMP2513" /LENGTH=110 /DNA_ID=CAMNT_0013301403 /DNA_START=1404 /DNA_END=1736 /DNA_ORIENTATION=-